MMSEIQPATVDQVAAVVRLLPEFLHKNSSEEIASRIAGREHDVCVLSSGRHRAGFLVCYKEDDGAYYNWIMGVLPEHRRNGFAYSLIRYFAASALRRGCGRLRIKTMNKYRSMLKLLIDCGFDIVGIQDSKIVFESSAQQVVAMDTPSRRHGKLSLHDDG